MTTSRRKSRWKSCRSTKPSRTAKPSASSKLRAERSKDAVARQLAALRKASQGKDNLMPFILDAVKSYATLGEICDAMRDTFGTYEEVAIT